MNAPMHHRAGDVWGLPVMKFTLTYDGDLSSTGNGSKKTQAKWDIRKHFHPQLAQLWRVSPRLRAVKAASYVPKAGGFWSVENHHSKPLDEQGELTDDQFDLCEPIIRAGRRFMPLVRNSYALTCGLKILFLRQEPVGRVYQGGDLDNRIKTLLDALSIPPHDNHVIDDPTMDEPIYCLLEDDSLVTGVSVETQRLLTRPNMPESEVRLIIEVDVRVSDSRSYNSAFLGD